MTGAEVQLTTPVAFFVFNRPIHTARVFDRIRKMQPRILLLIADGPRAGRKEDDERCREVRMVLERVDWPCIIHKTFSEKNLGCGVRIRTGLDWVFTIVDEAIILEDDCLPEADFFLFCEKMLQRFRDSSRVLMVSGHNELGEWKKSEASYFFTLGNIWGWATWRRAWALNDPDLAQFESLKATDCLQSLKREIPALADLIGNGCREVKGGHIDTWDYQWAFSRVLHNGLGVVPAVNLIENIGFDQNATHTSARTISPLPAVPLCLPLRHNDKQEMDWAYYRNVFGPGWLYRIRCSLSSWRATFNINGK